jgi:hypothetical protein
VTTKRNAGLVDRVQAELESYRNNTPIGGQPDFKELAVSIVRVFRNYIDAELKRPDAYDNDQPGKGQGWE